MKQKDYDKRLIRWVKRHYWDSLEKDKDLILRHLRTFAGEYEDCTNCEDGYMPKDEEDKTNRPNIEQIKERCDKATEGPWAWDSPYEKVNGYVVGIAVSLDGKNLEGKIDDPDDMVDDIIEYQTYLGDHESSTCNYGDPDFISHARTDIPKLLDWITELEFQLKTAREAIGWWNKRAEEAI